MRRIEYVRDACCFRVCVYLIPTSDNRHWEHLRWVMGYAYYCRWKEYVVCTNTVRVFISLIAAAVYCVPRVRPSEVPFCLCNCGGQDGNRVFVPAANRQRLTISF
jgi:hypothetical protein